MIVTFDGATGSDKKELLKLIVRRTSFRVIRVSHFFRAIAYFYIKHKSQPTVHTIDTALLDKILEKHLPNILPGEGELIYFVRGTLHTLDKELYLANVSLLIPKIMENMRAREKIHSRIRQICLERDWIIDGRDAGAIIFPDADLKFYLDLDSFVAQNKFTPDYGSSSYKKNQDKKKAKKKPANNTEKALPLQKKTTIFHQEKLYFSSSIHSDTIYINVSHLETEEVYEKIIKIIKFKIKYD